MMGIDDCAAGFGVSVAVDGQRERVHVHHDVDFVRSPFLPGFDVGDQYLVAGDDYQVGPADEDRGAASESKTVLVISTNFVSAVPVVVGSFGDGL